MSAVGSKTKSMKAHAQVRKWTEWIGGNVANRVGKHKQMDF
jgi:hypothetical protein